MQNTTELFHKHNKKLCFDLKGSLAGRMSKFSPQHLINYNKRWNKAINPNAKSLNIAISQFNSQRFSSSANKADASADEIDSNKSRDTGEKIPIFNVDKIRKLMRKLPLTKRVLKDENFIAIQGLSRNQLSKLA